MIFRRGKKQRSEPETVDTDDLTARMTTSTRPTRLDDEIGR